MSRAVSLSVYDIALHKRYVETLDAPVSPKVKTR
jgi:hypothetical protein